MLVLQDLQFLSLLLSTLFLFSLKINHFISVPQYLFSFQFQLFSQFLFLLVNIARAIILFFDYNLKFLFQFFVHILYSYFLLILIINCSIVFLYCNLFKLRGFLIIQLLGVCFVIVVSRFVEVEKCSYLQKIKVHLQQTDRLCLTQSVIIL